MSCSSQWPAYWPSHSNTALITEAPVSFRKDGEFWNVEKESENVAGKRTHKRDISRNATSYLKNMSCINVD